MICKTRCAKLKIGPVSFVLDTKKPTFCSVVQIWKQLSETAALGLQTRGGGVGPVPENGAQCGRLVVEGRCRVGCVRGGSGVCRIGFLTLSQWKGAGQRMGGRAFGTPVSLPEGDEGRTELSGREGKTRRLVEQTGQADRPVAVRTPRGGWVRGP